MRPIERYLETLGVPRGVSKEELKTAYRALIRVTHPDRFYDNEALRKKAEEQTKVVNEAYNYLLNNFEKISAPEPPEVPRPRPSTGKPRRPENRTGRARTEEDKKRQHAEYLKRKALRERREARLSAQDRVEHWREKQTLILGIAFVVLLFLYALYTRRQAMTRGVAEPPPFAAQGGEE